MAYANKPRYDARMLTGSLMVQKTLQQAGDALGAVGRLNLPAAGVAFFAFLSLVPTLAALVALWGLFADPTRLESVLAGVAAIAPAEAFGIIETQLTALAAAPERDLSIATALSFGLALFAARAGMSALLSGLAGISGVPRTDGFLLHQLMSIGFTLVLILAALCTLGLMVILPALLKTLAADLSLDPVVLVLRWAVPVGVILFGLSVLYRYGMVHKRDRPAWISPGAVLAVILWVLVSQGFATYLSTFQSYAKLYGSLGAIAVLLVWFYLSAYAILIGALTNKTLSRWRAARRKGHL
ncbi:MAG: YihY/virulence factor BrkB family protein [Pseudomonadota bacterium]